MPQRLTARPLRWFAVIAAGAVLAAGCGSSSDSPRNAAVVNGDTISDAGFQKDLKALAGNDAFMKLVNQSGGSTDTANSSSTVPAALSAQWLSLLIQEKIIEQDFAHDKLTVTAAAKAQAAQVAAQRFSDEATFKKFPKWFRDREEQSIARTLSLLGKKPTDAQLQADFAKQKDTLCASGRVVSHILVASQAEADAIETQLKNGADFAALAKAKSTDTGSGAQGGSLGCYVEGQFVQEFDNVAKTLPVGQISAPVQSQYGWHIIKADPVTFESMKSTLEQNAVQQQSQKLSARLDKQLKAAKVTVNPKYGTVKKTPQFTVDPPKQPAVKSKPKATTSTSAPAVTAPAAAGG